MKNPFALTPQKVKPLTRLTDIETEEVSLVDKAANKRKFAVIKRDTETTTMATEQTLNTSKFLEGLTTGLEQLTTLTELVKAKVEKAEDASMSDMVDWKSSMTAMLNWASGEMSGIFGTSIDTQPADTGMQSEVAAQTTGTASPTGDAASGEAKLENDTMGKETAAQMVAGTASPTGDAASGEAKLENDTMGKEIDSVMITGTTTVGEVGKPEDTHSSGSVINKAKEFTASVLDMASTEVTEEKLEKSMGITEGLFFSGGFSVDAYDIEALAAVVNAICESMSDPDDIAKSADRIVAEVLNKSVAITKRISKADYKLTNTDSKEMKIATLLLKAVADGKKKAKGGKEASNAGELGKPDTDGKKTMKKEDALTAAEISTLVTEAVAKAVAPFAKETADLKAANAVITKEKTEVAKKLQTALSTTQSRASSSETVTEVAVTDTIVHPNSLGVSDYNAKGE